VGTPGRGDGHDTGNHRLPKRRLPKRTPAPGYRFVVRAFLANAEAIVAVRVLRVAFSMQTTALAAAEPGPCWLGYDVTTLRGSGRAH
jgi:hypothetical protein